VGHAEKNQDSRAAGGMPAGFPEFGELQRRDFESSPRPMSIFDRGTLQYLAVNDAALKLYGYTREEFLALTLRDTRHPGEHADMFASLARPAQTIARWASRRHVTRSGEVLAVETITQNILFGGRKARLCLTIDVTERDRMLVLLHRRQQEFMTLAEHSPDIISRLDRDFRHLYVNPAITVTTRRPPGDFVGRRVSEVGLAPVLAARWERVLKEAFETGVEQKLEAQYPGDKGPRYYESRIIPELRADGVVETVLVITRDFTEHKETEIALRRGAALAGLLESLARAANEAMTPEAAMTSCLELICTYGGWVLGRVALYGGGGRTMPLRSLWHTLNRERFASFIRVRNERIPDPRGVFMGRVMREQAAVWVEDLEQAPNFNRGDAPADHGLRSAFGFPIVARGEMVAIIEMFSEEPRASDPMIMGAAQSIASQLARIVDREWAHQSNARMAAIVESSQDAILSRMLDGTIISWNPGAERLFGYTAAEIIGCNVGKIIPPELHVNIPDRRVRLARGEPIPAHETLRLAKDGRRIHVSTSAAPIRDSSGEIWGISSIVRDISAQKEAERELRETQQHLQVAVRGGGVGLYDWDVRTNAVYFSPEWKRQLGCEDHEIRNDFSEWESRIHPDDRGRVEVAVRVFLANPAPDYQQEYRMKHRDGSYRWILSRASVQVDDNGGVERMFGCHVDITDQKRAEAGRLEAVARQRDALVREVHHRIKNSLQGVVGLLGQKILKKPAIATEIGETIAQLQSVALVYGLQETRPDGLLDLGEVMDAIISSAEDLIGGRVDRIMERRRRRPACLAGGEAVSVAFALNELIFNALKHQRAAAGSKRARVSLRESDDVVEIRISNRGRLPAGFDFDRGRAVGNGLGLVRTLLAAPGGAIAFNGGKNQVEVVLELRPPLLADARARQTRRS